MRHPRTRRTPGPTPGTDGACAGVTSKRTQQMPDIREKLSVEDAFAGMRATRATHPRRPPGAAALRYAIWVYMNAKRA